LPRFHRHFRILLLPALVATGWAGPSPGELLENPEVRLARDADRERIVRGMVAVENQRRTAARARATRAGLPLRTDSPGGSVQEIADFDFQDRPVYLTTHNASAAISTGANLLHSAPYSLSGSGMIVGVWDGGSVRTTHQEFGSRIAVMDGSSSIDHATHVGGTIAATGVVANARGMANLTTLHSYDWNNDTSEMTAAAATGPGQEATRIYLSNHSYGYISGWNYVGGAGSPARTWEWHGDGTTATSFEYDFGRYNTYSRSSDSLAFSAPYYLIFRSAGNERGDAPATGSNIALSPGSPTVVAYDPANHPAGDSQYRGGFDTIGFDALGKNVITVGSVSDAVAAGLRSPSNANISSFSSWGPTDDGRIKPDIVANGETLYSSLNGSNTAYGSYNGTSMSTPNACGTAALLVQLYRNLFPGQSMRSSTLKGLIIHTADDCGNAGPDYKYGWGLVNAKAAADLLIDHQAEPAKQRLVENQLTTSAATRTVSFVWDGVSPITATLCWTDPAGAATTTSDLRTPRLVNNLNLKIVTPGGGEYLPFVMPFVGTWTQASMEAPATTGINNTDNIEQVRIAAPPLAGTYQAVVSHAGTLTNNSQNYSLVISGSSTEAPPPPPLVLTGISPASALSSGTTTLTLTGTGLNADTAIKLTRSGSSDIIATGEQPAGENLTCQVELTGSTPGAWNVVATKAAETSTLPNAFTVVGAIFAQNFDGAVTGWTSSTTTGSNAWSVVTTGSHSPAQSYFAPGPAARTTTYLTSPPIFIASGATNIQLKFWHQYNLSGNDGGRLEFSLDGGSWFDITSVNSGAVFASNGYNATLKLKGVKSDFAGMAVWKGSSAGFVETIVNLTNTSKYAGHTLNIRWGIATDDKFASTGWHVDSISLTAGGNLANQAPVVSAVTTSSSTGTVTDDESTVRQILISTSANVSAAANDDGGEPSLTYTWSGAGGSAPVYFAPNGSNTAKNSIAYFEAAGDYDLTCSATDNQGLSTTSTLNVRVTQTASGIVVSPSFVSLTVGGSRAFAAQTIDQFGTSMTTQPSAFTWSASGGGSINTSGFYVSNLAGGPYTISASSGAFTGTASVTVNPQPATVTLSNLSHIHDGFAKSATVTTDPVGKATTVTYNQSPDLPVGIGEYAVEAVFTDPNYQGSATGTLVIAPGNNYVSWSYIKFTTEERAAGMDDMSADPEHDGLTNLAEYALGTEPKQFTPLPAPVVADGNLTLTFTRPTGLPVITYGAEQCDHFDDWQPAALELIGTSGGIDTMRVRVPLATGDPSRHFLRLRFNSP
jgi:Subtilase family/MBG domain